MVNAKYIPTLLLLLAATLASCVYDDAPVLRNDDGRQAVQVTFTLAAGNAPTETRADATAWENAIDQLQVLVYDADGTTRVGQVENLIRFSNDNGQSYTYHGQLTTPTGTELSTDTPYKFVILANIDPNLTDNNTLGDLTFEQGADYIPMWGVTTQKLTLTPGIADNLGPINLLRAMAKVEVCLSDKLKDKYTLEKVTLNRYNKTGYCLPAGYNDVTETTKLDREGDTPASFNPCPPASTAPIDFDVDETAVCYLPEYEKDADSPAQLTITLNDEAYTLDLKDYTSDAYYNLVRNHIYRYTITGVNDGTLTVKYRVLPWEKISSSIGWDAKLTMKPWSKGENEAIHCYVTKPSYVSNSNHHLRYNTSSASFAFTLTQPEGAVWTAYLTNTEDFGFSTSEYDADGDDIKDTYRVSRGITRTVPYHIQINARNEWTHPTSEEEPIEIKEDGSNLINTDKGNEWETENIMPRTYLYITLSTDGVHETLLEINPAVPDGNFLDEEDQKTPRQFAGTATHICITQVKITAPNQQHKDFAKTAYGDLWVGGDK